jgi:hypothetical protein
MNNYLTVTYYGYSMVRPTSKAGLGRGCVPNNILANISRPVGKPQDWPSRSFSNAYKLPVGRRLASEKDSYHQWIPS